jgi:lactoylglutathione lyase
VQLNHLNLPVSDVAVNRDFFVKHFGMVTVMERGNVLAMLRDDGGMLLNLSHFDKGTSAEIVYHKDFHVGFFVETTEEVNQIYGRLVADGLSVEPPKKMTGRFTFYVDAPGGFPVEVACLEKPTG